MNNETLNELKERAMKATKGPWMTWPTTACNGEYTGLDVMTHDGGALITEETHPSDDDALFIAAANPAAILELIALAERALLAAAPSPAVDGEDETPVAYIAQLSKISHKSLTWSNYGGFVGTEYIPLYTRPSPSLAKPNADCSGEPANCPDNEGYGCACDPMNKSAMREKP